MDGDRDLIRDAFVKIARAIGRGSLSPFVTVHLAGHTWLDVGGCTQSDYAWLRKNFGEPTIKQQPFARRIPGTRGRKAYLFHETKWELVLRETDPSRVHDWAPRVLVDGPRVEHKCSEFRGFVGRDGKGKWACADHRCKKRISRKKAIEVGLVEVVAP